MTDAELDRAIAVEVMGWKSVEAAPEDWEHAAYWQTEKGTMAEFFWIPSTDPRQIRQVEGCIKQRGLIEDYVRELRRVLYRDHGDDDTMPQLWRFVTATPRQRCHAALLAVRTYRRVNGEAQKED